MCFFCAGLLIVLLAVILFCFWQNRKMQKEIQSLICYLTKVQDNLELPDMDKVKEGNLAILQSEIYKVVALLQQSYSLEVKQKRYLADMLLDISHQIKTPLTAISVMTDLLSAPKLDEEQRFGYIAKIEQQTNKITWLVHSLLTLAQLDADVLELKQEAVFVNEIFEQIKDTFELMAEIKNVTLSISLDSRLVMKCDKRWTTEAISNIVKNCIEHTQTGGTVRLTAGQDNLATHIHISDNGEGIAPEHLEHVFERFYKPDSSSADSVGIGLALAKQIIIKQNGIINVKSKVGCGSDFYIKLYAARQSLK